MTRKTNPELCAEFRALLAGDKTVEHFNDAAKYLGVERHAVIDATRNYRGDLWKAFREIEARLCPEPPREQ